MSEFDRSTHSRIDNGFDRFLRRAAIAAGFLMVSGIYITPAGAMGSTSEDDSVIYQVGRETSTRTPTPHTFATQLHEVLVTQSALTNKSSRLEAAATQQAAALQTMAEGGREIRTQIKEKDTEIKILQGGVVLSAIIAAGYFIKKSYGRSSHGGGHH